MKRSIVWVFLLTAPLVSASSLASFEATCSGTRCVGNYGAIAFDIPFIGGGARVSINGSGPGVPYDPFIQVGIGTHGGSFTDGVHTCDYSVVLGHGMCDAGVTFGANLGPPDDTGFSLGDVATVRGTGNAQASFCWGLGCPAGGSVPPPPSSGLDVSATYQFTLTDPGTPWPFTWTGAQFSSVPEPGTFLFAAFGLMGFAAGRQVRRRRSRSAGAL